jgi:glycosyltransferase involved in cell wall biosynthesis
MTTKPRTLVILTPGFPSDETDTVCLPAQQLFVSALNRNFPDLRVIVISFEYPHRRDRYTWFGNTVIAIGGWKDGWGNKAKTIGAVWRALDRLRRANDVIGLLSFWIGGCALVGKYYSSWHRLLHFTWILGQDARKGNKFIPLIRPKDKELVAMSDFLADELYRNYAIRPLHIIPNGVDPSLYAPAGSQPRDIDLLGVGSLIPLKQYDLFLLAVRDLQDRLPGVRVAICGKGPEEEHLKALILEYRLQGNVTMTGELPHIDILRMMQRARVFLHTSSYEGFSTVCLEALYAGAQVVSFRKAMDAFIPHWHVVKTKDDLIGKVFEILGDEGVDHVPVFGYAMDDSARAMMKLYNYP